MVHKKISKNRKHDIISFTVTMICLIPYSFGISFWKGFIILVIGNLIFEAIWASLRRD